jgi:uncharacterized protein (DUF2062 family)
MKIKYTAIGKLLRQLKVSFKKLLHLRDSTHEISLGFAMGVFVGILPTFGFGALILGILAIPIRFNIFAALVGTLVNNPLFVPFWLTSSYKVGEIITRMGINLEKGIISNILEFSISYLVGNIILATICGIISYFIMYIIIETYRVSRSQEKNQS